MQASYWTKVLYTRQLEIGINPGDMNQRLGKKTRYRSENQR
jgi:hypothetical protein